MSDAFDGEGAGQGSKAAVAGEAWQSAEGGEVEAKGRR